MILAYFIWAIIVILSLTGALMNLYFSTRDGRSIHVQRAVFFVIFGIFVNSTIQVMITMQSVNQTLRNTHEFIHLKDEIAKPTYYPYINSSISSLPFSYILVPTFIIGTILVALAIRSKYFSSPPKTKEDEETEQTEPPESS